MTVSTEPTSDRPPIRLGLDIDPRREPIAGVVRDGRGRAEPFVGWLGLMERVEALRDDDDP